jgi:3-phenylpropionate/cinnamic acid dioxygenase small subunit
MRSGGHGARARGSVPPMDDARGAIANLIFTYAERIDLGDYEGLADLFAHAEITADGRDTPTRGRDEVLAMYTASTRKYDNGTPRTKHVTTNLIVEVDEGGDAATCRSYFTVMQAVPGGLHLQPVIAGRYHDRFERADGAWRFARRHMIVDLVGDLSQHLLFAYPGSTA